MKKEYSRNNQLWRPFQGGNRTRERYLINFGVYILRGTIARRRNLTTNQNNEATNANGKSSRREDVKPSTHPEKGRRTAGNGRRKKGGKGFSKFFGVGSYAKRMKRDGAFTRNNNKATIAKVNVSVELRVNPAHLNICSCDSSIPRGNIQSVTISRTENSFCTSENPFEIEK